MEGSVAGGGDAGGGDAGGEGVAAEAAQGLDLGPVMSHLEQITGRLDGFDGRLTALAPEPEEPPDPFDMSDLYADDPDQGFDMQQVVQRLQEASQTHTQQAIEQALAPVLDSVRMMRADGDAQSLIAAYPELAEPQVAEAVVNNARSQAARMGLPAEYANSADFIDMTLKAQKFDQHVSGQVPVAGLDNPELEAGAGANPGGRGDGPSTAEQIKAARGGNAFWGA